jgi:hypothetical protein
MVTANLFTASLSHQIRGSGHQQQQNDNSHIHVHVLSTDLYNVHTMQAMVSLSPLILAAMVAGSIPTGRWVAKLGIWVDIYLVARLLATAARWVLIQISPKNIKWTDISKGVANRL